MKKIIISRCFIALVGLFVCSVASAQTVTTTISGTNAICGIATIKAIRLYESYDCISVADVAGFENTGVAGFENNVGPTSFDNQCTSDMPKEACDVSMELTIPGDVTQTVTATAFGTQINLALLKAFNGIDGTPEPIFVCLWLDPQGDSSFKLHVHDVTFTSGGVTTTINPPQPSTTTTSEPATTTSTTSANSTTTSTSGTGGGGGSSPGGTKTTTTTVTTTSVTVTTTTPPSTTSITIPPPCNDGLFCNGVETFSNGNCIPGQPPCGDAQLCKENLKQCWDVITIDATSLNKSIWRPIIREHRCLWLVAKVAEDNHYTAGGSSIAAVSSVSDAQGVSIDPRRKTLVLFKGKLFLIPICVERGATVGQWSVVIKTDVGSVPLQENIVTSFQVK